MPKGDNGPNGKTLISQPLQRPDPQRKYFKHCSWCNILMTDSFGKPTD